MPCLVPAATPSSLVAEVLERDGFAGFDRLSEGVVAAGVPSASSTAGPKAACEEREILDPSALSGGVCGRGRRGPPAGVATGATASSPSAPHCHGARASCMNVGSNCGQWLIPEREDGDNRLCVVLDLDETLIYNRAQCMLTASNEIVHRPHLHEFLSALSATCEVVLWTASTAEVASSAVLSIDPFQRLFDHVITRTPKWFTGIPYEKNLRLLGRPLDRMIIVENNPDCVLSHRERAIIVQDFRAIPTPTPDLTLLVVLELLEEISQSTDAPDDILASSTTLTHRRYEGGLIHEVPEKCKPLYMPLS